MSDWPVFPAADLSGQRVLVTGAGGQLGRFLAPALLAANAAITTLGSRPGDGIDIALDLADPHLTSAAITSALPDVIIHAAAGTDVDGIERSPERGVHSNVRATQNVARAAREASAYMIAVSTDMVFPGDGGAPYGEDAPPRPLSAYGASKLRAEESVLGSQAGFAVARTAWLYGGAGKHFPRTVLTILRDRGTMDVVDDEFGSPTYAGDLALALTRLTAVRGSGIFHLVNSGRASRFALARQTAQRAGFDAEQVRPISTVDFLARYPLPAPRPPDSTLQNVRAAALGIEMRHWREALDAYVPTLVAETGALPPNGDAPGG